MINEETLEQNQEKETSTALSVDVSTLDRQALEIINQVIAESDVEKTKDLTNLFNLNQKKKTMVRVNTLNELQDLLIQQQMQRVKERPDNMTQQELTQAIKTVQDLIDRGITTVSGVNDTPLIQINNQDNSVNVGPEALSKASRDKVNSFVMDILRKASVQSEPEAEVIDAEVKEKSEDGNQ